ncbi:hypothetical protein IEQ34_013508 [Dendrobium chrysotoxum]|uniref:Uncharacterized protein n=1 Tax=Dendrobium chrysotoxum TaxID=161865 RepID=A0AAV7GRJ9_DENCH|nr:hypothetical protein IEQ34_013508 [Dendrobium chrysotoxum]
MAAALASNPDVGSSMNMIEGLATSSTAIVNRFLCSVDKPETPERPTIASLRLLSSTKPITSSTNACKNEKRKGSYHLFFITHFLRKTKEGRIYQGFPNCNLRTSKSVVFPAPLTPIRAVKILGRKAPVTSVNSCNRSWLTWVTS